MKVTKSKLKQIISEELKAMTREGQFGDNIEPMSQPVASYDLDTDLMDPTAGDPDALFNNAQVASRILEDLPMDLLPEEIKMAAENLRVALDEMSQHVDMSNNA